MDNNSIIQDFKKNKFYEKSIKKLILNDNDMTSNEKTFLLSCAILLIKKYQLDNRYTSYMELAYYIILKYSINYSDYEPLYDFSVNFGFYPIAQSITRTDLFFLKSINHNLIRSQIDSLYDHEGIIETFEQKKIRNGVLESSNNEISYIAPTSFGKSTIIIEHIILNSKNNDKIGIIVPTKSLLIQTYRKIKEAKLNYKILIHDDMYNSEERFIAIFTQERALRLMGKSEVISFDILYVDEAHLLLDKDSRSVLLSRLLRLNKMRNKKQKIIYLSPLISDSSNLKINNSEIPEPKEYRIRFNIKEPEYFEYRTDKSIHKYNRFTDTFYEIGTQENMWEYILKHKTSKTFIYLYRPQKIEQFSKELCGKIEDVSKSEQILDVVGNLQKYVHPDFYIIDYLKKGIIYLHGKIPDNVKEYLVSKFIQIPNITFLVANHVILEGMNMPIDSLFILSVKDMNKKDLTNLIGRVNRLDQIFGSQSINLEKLNPQIHFVNSDAYNRKKGNMSNKIKELKTNIITDDVKNPILKKEPDKTDKIIIDNEESFFSKSNDPKEQLKKKMLELGMFNIYIITDSLCDDIYIRIHNMKNNYMRDSIHIMDKIRIIFVSNLKIEDKEFSRLDNDPAINYYKMFLENRHYPLSYKINKNVSYFQKRQLTEKAYLYIGESFGEISLGGGKEVYIDLKGKTKKELVNISIIKQKIEEDFVSFKLNMFVQLLFDYDIIQESEYNEILYGTNDPKKLNLVKMGLTIDIINKLINDNQLGNIIRDENGNFSGNDDFLKYAEFADDFYKFELSKILL
ncbi:DEAD/DEAH box helicase [Methanolapillus ohkumae]|uniref:DEAD/DEAH box helicase n=1 Tax=Methanolapillus ohkumae TaxID=3028298 RepID=A0AA96VIK4_9EURY|nr:hypothetical protein MsAm2_09280 [Methanosarcinaceae archaeon Am2]